MDFIMSSIPAAVRSIAFAQSRFWVGDWRFDDYSDWLRAVRYRTEHVVDIDGPCPSRPCFEIGVHREHVASDRR